jgi:hypothetical protein
MIWPTSTLWTGPSWQVFLEGIISLAIYIDKVIFVIFRT